MLWLLALLIGATLLGSVFNIVDKLLMGGTANGELSATSKNNSGCSPLTAVLSFAIPAFPVACSVFLYLAIPTDQVLMSFSAGIIYVIAAWLYYSAAKTESMSVIAPLLRLVAPQTLILGVVFLQNNVTDMQLVGFTVVLISSLVVSVRWQAIFQRTTPRSGASATWLSKGALLTILCTAFLAAQAVLNGYVYLHAGPLAGVVWECVGVVFSSIVVASYTLMRKYQQVANDIILTAAVRPALAVTAGSGLIAGQAMLVTSIRLTIAVQLAIRSVIAVGAVVWLILATEQILRLLTTVFSAYLIAGGMSIGIASVIEGLRPGLTWLLEWRMLKTDYTFIQILASTVSIVGMAVGIYFLL